MTKIIVVSGLVSLLAAGAWMYHAPMLFSGGAAVQQARQTTEIERLRLEQRRLYLRQIREERETLVTAARLKKEQLAAQTQARIDNAPEVVAARINSAVMAASWPLYAVFTLGAAAVSVLAFAAIRRVPFRHDGLETFVSRRQAAVLASQSIYLQGLDAQVRAAAFMDETLRERMTAGVNVFATLARTIRGATHAALPAEQTALPAAAEPTTASLPTFAEIFASRELHGDLVLGYIDDAPRLGRYEAVHSCLIYGLARSGKTSWLRGLIGQTILTEPETRCYVLDPHQARKDSLLGSLPKTRHFQPIDSENPLPALEEFGAELRRRLLSEEESFPPRILLIDELNQLTKEPYKPQLVALCEAVCQRGRKVNVFLLATAQDLREKKIGDFRTSISSAYFFKGKSSQVKAFLADSDAERVYRRNVTRHGVALFSSADEEPRLMSIPECRPQDLLRLGAGTQPTQPSVDTGADVDAPQANVGADVIDFAARREQRGNTTPTVSSTKQPESGALPALPQDALAAQLREYLQAQNMSLSKFADGAGVNKGLLSVFLRGEKRLSEAMIEKVTAAMRGETREVTA